MTCSVEDAAESVMTRASAMHSKTPVEWSAFPVSGANQLATGHHLSEGVDGTFVGIHEHMQQNP